jgi:excisionase family DNA binding protein
MILEDDMDTLLLTPTEAATALGIGRSKVYELMQTGQLQSVHNGACRRVPAEALTAFSSSASAQAARHDESGQCGNPQPGGRPAPKGLTAVTVA